MARSLLLTTITGVVLFLIISSYIIFNFLRAQFPYSAFSLPHFTYFGREYSQDGFQDQDYLRAKDGGNYLLGVAKADITGPIVEINMMGYADTDQVGSGLRQRLYCRAFIVANDPSSSLSSNSELENTKNDRKKDKDRSDHRLLYLVLDTQSGDTAIRDGILSGLADLGEEYGTYYTKDNVAVTGTHSHAGPGGWLNYLLPQITSEGFDRRSYQAIVDGSLLAIKRAHENLVPGHLYLGTAEIADTNTNRSPYAYDANPEEEKSRYSSNVDKTMTLLRFDRADDGKSMGVLTWFAVHGTSLYGNNTLIAGDNKGVAAYLFERYMSSTNPNFVAGFSQSNVGDTSPNILGAYCDDTGLPCRYNDSTCAGNRIDICHGRGPYFEAGDHGTKSCFEIGRRQFIGARNLFNNHSTGASSSSSTLRPLTGGRRGSIISSLHTFVNLSSYTFESPLHSSKKLRTTCSAALGHSFAAGTTDGPGHFDFKQGTSNDSSAPSTRNPLWRVAREFVHEPDEAQIKCQAPKPILLDVGAAQQPYAWTPDIVDIQLLRVGGLVIIISPGEATTMSGRRWREAIAKAAETLLHIPQPTVVLGGPANTYVHYIATEEEYSVQRYEGASTLHGPHTLEAYINLTLTHLPYLDTASNARNLSPLNPGPSPPINTNRSLCFITPVLFDGTSLFKSFGDVLQGPSASFYHPGGTVSTRFVGANPRNNFRLEGTFAAVEKQREDGDGWDTVRTDRDWHLVFRWERKITLLGTSEVVVEWEIEDDATTAITDTEDGNAVGSSEAGWRVQEGIYRLRYFGDAKGIDGHITPFEGVGNEFPVVRS